MKAVKSIFYSFSLVFVIWFKRMNIYFNPLDSLCKNIIGAVRQGDELQISLFLLKDAKEFSYNITTPLPEECTAPDKDGLLFFGKDGEKQNLYLMKRTKYGWTIRLKIHKTGLYFYHFQLDTKYIVPGKGGIGTETFESKTEFQLTVYAKNYQTPDWFKGGILYQIFPDRFCKKGTMSNIEGRINRSDWGGIPNFRPDEKGKISNNDFFGGNFKGIQSKLPYLKSLHITALYLNPIFEAASNHRYDTSDYMRVDPFLGTNEDFAELTKEAKKYGIRIILDGVFNHTGDNSVYFNKYGKYPSLGAYQSKESPYFSWYTFQDFPDKYSSWWGIDILPEVNEKSDAYQEFIFGESGVLKNWLSYGIGGYRLDVADELPDFFLKKLRKAVKDTNSEAIILGEVWEDASNKISYSKRREYLQGYELDSVMNYPLKDAIIRYIITGTAEELADTVRFLQDHYPKQTLDCLMNILSTHDTARILTVLGEKSCYNKEEMADESFRLNEYEKAVAIEKVKMAALLQYSFPGVPCIYYGDENGMEGYIDPFCRKCFDWDNLNEDLISYYKNLGEIRTLFRKVFAVGLYKELYVKNGFFLFQRSYNGTQVYIYTNNSSEGLFVKIFGKFHDYLNGKDFENIIEIKPHTFGIFSKIDGF